MRLGSWYRRGGKVCTGRAPVVYWKGSSVAQNWQKRAVSGLAAPQLSQYCSFSCVVIAFPFYAKAVTILRYLTFQHGALDRYLLLKARPALPHLFDAARAPANYAVVCGALRNRPVRDERSYHAGCSSVAPRPSSRCVE